MNSLNFITYNVKGLGNPIKRKKILSHLKKLQCSIAMLQETHLSEKEHLKLKREWVDQVFSSSFENGRRRGVAILFNKSVYFSQTEMVRDKEGRYIIVKGAINGIKLTLLNLYAPNEDSPDFFKDIAGLLADVMEGLVLIGGDFNCIWNQYMDKLPAGGSTISRKSSTLHAMASELGLVDVWRRLHPREKDFTFMSQVHGSYSRLDMMLISGPDLYRVKECKIEPITISDHAPVTLKMELGPKKSFRYWRLNVSLLNDEIIKQEIRQELKHYFEANEDDTISPVTLWEGAKAVMRGCIIAISCRLKKQRVNSQNKLEEKIKQLEREHQQSNKEDTLQAMKDTRKELDDLLTYKTEGALRFINRKYYEMGNKASRLLAFQLRKAQSSRAVHKIKSPDNGETLTQPTDITKAFAMHYRKLYEEQSDPQRNEKMESFFSSIDLPKLTSEEADMVSSPITEEEIKNTIAQLKNNKSPGTDGFSGEYYKAFVGELTPILCNAYNYALEKGQAPASWSEAIISVIHKENKDPTLCASYRPISLLCVDFKILTSIIAKRIQKIIHKLVKPDQTGFITNRHGVDNVRRALHLQFIAAKRDTPSALLSLDAQSAFDRISWAFLLHTLRHMGFNDTFTNWIRLFYKDPKSRVRVNGYCSDFFPLSRGTRQGDSLSPSLFALSIEPLAELIRSNPLILGIPDDGGSQHKLALFADDILLFIERPMDSIPALLDSLNKYSEISGYKINTSKSEAMMIRGEWPQQLDSIVSFKKSKNGFRYLGVILTPKPSQLFHYNYDKLIKEIYQDLSRWDVLPLSFFGRIESVRMNVLPRLLFLFQSLPILIPQRTIKCLEKRISTFIWQNRRPRIRLKILMASKKRGGLGLPNLKLYYWAAQLRAIVVWMTNAEETGWLSIEQNSLTGIPLSVLPFLDRRAQKKIKIENMWVKHTLKIWNTVQKQIKGSVALSRVMPILGNFDFLPSLTDMAFRRWAEKGLVTIDQLFENNTLRSFSQLQEKFDLPMNDLFRFMQIRSYLTRHSDWDYIKRDPMEVESYFIMVSQHKVSSKHQVSYIYKSLLTDTSDNTLHIKSEWELELNAIIEDEAWEKTCLASHKGIGSQMWKEFDWKVKLRFFRTPLKVSRFSNTAPNTCWRNCGMVGDHAHIFWDCPAIQTFWKNIKEDLDTVFRVDIPLDPLIFMLEIIPENLLSKDQCYMLHILLMTAKKMITVNWMQTCTPTKAQWLQKIKQIKTMENMTAILQFKLPLFIRRWTPVILGLKLD